MIQLRHNERKSQKKINRLNYTTKDSRQFDICLDIIIDI